MSKLISSDEQIREIIPNLQVAVVGQTSWLDRLNPFLLQAEAYLQRYITRIDIPANDDALLPLAAAVVAWRAWFLAVPSLDLVATPNGFAVVSNQTLSPASQARVAAAKENASEMADSAVLNLIRELANNPDWLNSRHAKQFFSLFPLASGISEFFLEAKPVSFYLRNAAHIIQAEIILAVNTVSRQAMEFLRHLAWELALNAENANNFSQEDISILQAVRKAVAIQIFDPIDNCALRHQCHVITNLLDQAIDSVAASRWKESIIYSAFKSKPFINEKNSGGFFL